MSLREIVGTGKSRKTRAHIFSSATGTYGRIFGYFGHDDPAWYTVSLFMCLASELTNQKHNGAPSLGSGIFSELNNSSPRKWSWLLVQSNCRRILVFLMIDSKWLSQRRFVIPRCCNKLLCVGKRPCENGKLYTLLSSVWCGVCDIDNGFVMTHICCLMFGALFLLPRVASAVANSSSW